MQTSLHIDGANCPTCFNETLEDLAKLDGVHHVHGSFAGPCIEVEHDGALDTITDAIRNRMHGIEMFANEIRMVPLEPVSLPATCPHHSATCARDVESADTRAPATVALTIDPTMTLGDIVTRYPSSAAHLEQLGLDYCCHGGRTLSEAARDAGLEPQAVAEELSAAGVDEPVADWAALGLVDLVDHIESVHHRYLWEELPRLTALLDKIVAVHGARHPELAEVQRLYGELRDDLAPHLTREEQELFPLVRQIATAADATGSVDVALASHIEGLANEHETVGDLLDELRRVTSGYATPADGCATYTAAYAALAGLEADTHLHVHKENNLLFPAVRARFAAPAAARASA